jgi:hypothetical protein
MKELMVGKLDPEDRVMDYKTEIYSQVGNLIKELGWSDNDDVEVQVGGALVSGIRQTEGVNSKWSKEFGAVTYQNDAFIVIKNKSRNPVVGSTTDPTLKQHHSQTVLGDK